MRGSLIETGGEMSKEIYPMEMSLNNKLLKRKSRLEEELKTVNEAIELFGKNPDLEKAINLMARISL